MVSFTELYPKNFRPVAAIADLTALKDENRVLSGLRRIASAYGKVESVYRLPEQFQAMQRRKTGRNVPLDLYLVSFASVADALHAAAELRCVLFRFHAMVVPVGLPPQAEAALQAESALPQREGVNAVPPQAAAWTPRPGVRGAEVDMARARGADAPGRIGSKPVAPALPVDLLA
jgi:hypothetical protein